MLKVWHRPAVLTVVVLWLPASVRAQEPVATPAETLVAPDTIAVLQPGARVRVTLSNRAAPAPLIGTVLRVSADSLIVEREEGGVRALAPRHVNRIEVSVLREQDPAKAAAYGILTFLPGLLLWTAAIPVALGESDVSGSTVLGIVLLPWALAAVGGAAIGATSPQDVWIEVPWPDLSPLDTVPADSSPGDDRR